MGGGGGGRHLSGNSALIRFHHGQLEFGGGGGHLSGNPVLLMHFHHEHCGQLAVLRWEGRFCLGKGWGGGGGEGYWDIHHEAVLFSRVLFIDIWRRMQFLNIEHGRGGGGGTMDRASSSFMSTYFMDNVAEMQFRNEERDGGGVGGGGGR